MENAILLGVDGGNTKTDFFLFTGYGACIGHVRTGSCSHEALPGGFADAEAALKDGVARVCEKAGIRQEEISVAVFGLAGCDTREQDARLSEIAERMLPGKTLVCNDSMLGIMAVAPMGIGVCCINGTATSVSGIDENKTRLQVGGIGAISSDFAGGDFAAQEVLRYVYSACYRDGEETVLTSEVLKLLGADETADLLELFHPDHLKLDKKLTYELDRLLFRSAEQGDGIAQKIVRNMANTLARNTAGCVKRLHFREMVTIVLAGSLWVKSGYAPLLEEYRREVERRVGIPCRFVILEESPALGAVLEAYRRLAGESPSQEVIDRMVAAINME